MTNLTNNHAPQTQGNGLARTLFLCGAVILSSATLVALSEQAVAAAGDPQVTEGDTLVEVVVTAERVESTVQRTPISLEVVSGNELQKNDILNLANLTQIEPSVIFNQGQFNGASATIRGVSSSSGAAVTINFDGQYILSGFNPALFDIARIEVLKGPQGTLYGENSTGGNINIVTNAPKLGEFSLDSSGEYGKFNERSYDATMNIPLGETAALRLSAFSTAQDGYRTHPGMDNTDFANTNALRVSLLWKPFDKLTFRLTGEYNDENFGGPSQQGVLVNPSALTPAGQAPNNFTSAGVDPYNWALNYQGSNTARATFVRGNIDYDLGFATLTYLGAYRHYTNPLSQPAFGTATQTTDYQSVYSRTNTDQQELRLNGTTSYGTRWQVGGFYLDNKNNAFTNIFAGVTAFSPPRTVPFLTFDIPDNSEIDKAGYAQVTQNLTSTLSLTAGFRYTAVNQSNNPDNVSTLNVGPYFGSGGTVIGYTTVNTGGRLTYDKSTYRGAIDYQITPSNLIYGSVSTGFRDGGFTSFNSFQPEEITAYEIGSKNQFADNRIQANAAVFYYKYTNQQETLFVVQPSGVAASTTVNAGASTLKGAEASVDWLYTSNDRVGLSAS